LSKAEVATILLKRLSKAEAVTTRFKIDLPETDPERRLGLPSFMHDLNFLF
jgi:hypothetical protein